MKELRSMLFIIALIPLMVSGCGVKPAPPASSTIPYEEAAKTAAEASGTPIITVSDEKNYSLHSGELFAKNGNILIYAGEQDNIYMVNTKTNENRLLVRCDRPQKLYFDGTYVYYMPYYQMGRGIYRTSLAGDVKKICENSSIQLWLTDDKIYFTDQIGFDNINGTPQGRLCSMDKDGSNIRILVENVKNYFYIQDQWIYYTDLNSRSLYRAKLDGSNRQLLANGRTYINEAGDGYVIYADYADGETFHLINVQTGENTVLGQFGLSQRYNGKTYIQTREKDADGAAATGWSVLQVNEATGKTQKQALLNTSAVGIDTMQYVYDNWVYLYSTAAGNRHEKGVYRVKLSLDAYESEHVTDQYLYYLDGYGYYNKQDETYRQTGFSQINLTTGKITTWPLQ
ncbi:MAG TPA: DUF5050 domain-containing protein [Syntrophomonadaceae bacterium]|nr:DUF5050 domain-containing protein [Syntrophomonadaceae bacterium]